MYKKIHKILQPFARNGTEKIISKKNLKKFGKIFGKKNVRKKFGENKFEKNVWQKKI